MEDFLLISRYAGMREDLVQAGGGNSSVKLDQERMCIKASGVQLADVSQTDGYAIVNYRMITAFMDELAAGTTHDGTDQILQKALLKGKRPSMETFLHAITGKVTLHTHSLPVNVLTVTNNGTERLKELFPKALFVEYATPGVQLAKKYYEAYLEKSGGKDGVVYPVIFLKNHGLIVSGGTAEDVIRLTDAVNQKIEDEILLDCSAYRKAFEIFQSFERSCMTKGKIVVKAENEKLLQCFRKAGCRLWDYQFCPDCVVFLGRKPYDYRNHANAEDIQAFVQKYGEPAIITDGAELYIRADSVKKAREIESILAFSGQVADYAAGKPELLTEAEQKFLLNWEVETYRNQMK